MSTPDWHRIEPHARSVDMEEGLQARVADPCWMLARQWQVGEFRGEDAASPIHVRLRAETCAIRTFRNDAAGPSAPIEPFRSGTPLETRVEAEAVLDGPAAMRLSAEAGAQLLRRLGGAGLGGLRQALLAAFPLRVTAEVEARLPAAERNRLRLFAKRGLDGGAVYRARARKLQKITEDPSEETAFKAVIQAWRAEYRGRFAEPTTTGDTWLEERLEYGFSIAAATAEGEVVMEASEYAGGHLDWYSFDVTNDSAKSHGLQPRKPRVSNVETLPVPLAYPGMPTSRWWAFEEGSVYFGGLEAGPSDIGRLMLAEYATVYSDDWFLVPLRVPVGSLSRVTDVKVVDTFGRGRRKKVYSTADQDTIDAGAAEERAWSFFELTGDPSVDGAPGSPWLLLPPAHVGALQGPPVEKVSLIRDEAANVAWGIEQLVETALGGRLRRREQGKGGPASAAANPTSGGAPGSGAGETEEPWRYRLTTPVPPHWIPLLPERQGKSAQMRLRRGRLQAWDRLPAEIRGTMGKVLDPGGPLRLHEEEVPRGGVEVTRAWQLARNGKGELKVWMGRRKRPGIGERGSGLEFDRIERV